MNKYRYGSYEIRMFDKYGTKQRSIHIEGPLTEARQVAAENAIENGSHVILRVCENSLDDR